MNEFGQNYPFWTGLIMVILGLIYLKFSSYKWKQDEGPFSKSNTFGGFGVAIIIIIFGIYYMIKEVINN